MLTLTLRIGEGVLIGGWWRVELVRVEDFGVLVTIERFNSGGVAVMTLKNAALLFDVPAHLGDFVTLTAGPSRNRGRRRIRLGIGCPYKVSRDGKRECESAGVD